MADRNGRRHREVTGLGIIGRRIEAIGDDFDEGQMHSGADLRVVGPQWRHREGT